MQKSLELVVLDDDKMIIFLHKIMLEKSGLSSDPTCHIKAKELIKYLIENQATDKNFLILLDINMPEMDGWEFLDLIESTPFSDNIFVVVVTSSNEHSDKIKAMNYKSVVDYYEKPINTKSCIKIKSIPEIAKLLQSVV